MKRVPTCSVCKAAVRQRVEHSFVRIQLGSHEDQVLQSMRASIVVVRFGSDHEVSMNERTFGIHNHYRESRSIRTILGNCWIYTSKSMCSCSCIVLVNSTNEMKRYQSDRVHKKKKRKNRHVSSYLFAKPPHWIRTCPQP